ncbi:glycosyltransferase family 2 protein [bacterium]|nr:glycosyltransferase family 2 protein [bacterium]
MKKVSVFIPFLNESESLVELVERVETGGKAVKREIELIFVDDGSTDNGAEIVQGLQKTRPWIILLQHRISRGLTQAMKTGFTHATGDIIMFFPADLESHPDEDIPALLAGFDDGSHVVCGRRKGRRQLKVLMSRAYNDVSNFLFGTRLHDMNWIKAFKRECLNDLELRSDWHRFIAQILHDKGYKVSEVPVKWHRRAHGKSHFGLRRIPIAFLDSLAVKFVLTFTKAPMRIFGLMGILQLMTAIGIGGWLAYATWLLHQPLLRTRPLLYLIVILFISGLLFLFMGFLAELIVSLKEDIHKVKEERRNENS